MVLYNSSKRARELSRLINQPTAGGPSKTGLVPTVGLSSWSFIAYRDRGLPVSLSTIKQNRTSKHPNENLPIGFRYMRMR